MSRQASTTAVHGQYGIQGILVHRSFFLHFYHSHGDYFVPRDAHPRHNRCSSLSPVGLVRRTRSAPGSTCGEAPQSWSGAMVRAVVLVTAAPHLINTLHAAASNVLASCGSFLSVALRRRYPNAQQHDRNPRLDRSQHAGGVGTSGRAKTTAESRHGSQPRPRAAPRSHQPWYPAAGPMAVHWAHHDDGPRKT